MPFKQKADTTKICTILDNGTLFLPFKQKADTTGGIKDIQRYCCFYLSNRRQIQLSVGF